MERAEQSAEAVPPRAEVESGDHAATEPRSHARLRALRERFLAATVDNPILVKEFRTRMRGTRAYWILLAYTLLIATILGFAYFLHAQSRSEGYSSSAESAQQLGRVIYYIVFIAQAIMVALITPALTAGAITIEREQRSYELLVTTPLRPVDLIRGKLTAAVSFVVLLLTASLPLASLTFLVGGVSPAEIFFSYLLIALGAYAAGAIGIFWSATLRTTAVATVLAYITVMGLFFVALFPGAIAASNSGTGTGAMPEIPFQSLNPIMGVFRAVQPEHFFRWQLPSWVSASVMLLLFGTLMATQGLGRLEHFEKPAPLWPRLCATLLWTAGSAFLLGAPVGAMLKNTARQGAADEMISVALLVGLLMVLVVVPIWNSGDLIVRKGENPLGRYLRGMGPARMFRDNLPNGLPLTALWVGIFGAMVPLGLLTSGNPGLLFQTDALLPGLILVAAVAFGFAGIGNLLSVTVPSRWAAAILTYLSIITLVLLPYFALSPWAQMGPPKASPLWSLLYLVPFEGVGELASQTSFWSVRAPLPARPIWLVTSILYVAIGLGCLTAAALRVRKTGARLQARLPETEADSDPR